MLWACTAPPKRNDLFCPEAERRRVADLLSVGPDAALAAPLGVIAALVGRPDRIRAEQVALACRHISHWAEGRGALATALAFVQAAAFACPGDASAAFKVGQIARKRAENARAESWFRRTIALARQAGDWASYSLAFLGLGTLYMQRGSFPTARRFYLRCLRAARRHSLREIQGGACHDLHVIATASGNAAEAEQYARAAFNAYGPTNSRIPKLAHDVAYFWLTQGYFTRALSVFQALLPHMKGADDQIVVLPNIARAAGGAGEREIFEEAWQQFHQTAPQTEKSEGRAEALLELARGAMSLSEWERAEAMARDALQVAQERREARIEIMTEALLEAICHERRVETVTQPAAEPSTLEQGDALAQDLVRSLQVPVAVG